MTLSCTAPGNLLLAGEYAVLETGGLGVTVAVDRRVRVVARTDPGLSELRIAGSWGGEAVRWTATDRAASPLLDAVVRASFGEAAATPAEVEVDSSAFFVTPGRKIGYGSSAAVAAALTATLLRLRDRRAPEPRVLFSAALAAHRAFQGGRGSGYDVATSVFGGTGVFVGGGEPSWQPRPLDRLAGAVVFRGERSVATSGATARYRDWKMREPAAARRFLGESMRLVTELLAAASPAAFRAAFVSLRDLGLALGETIGVSAAIEPPEPLRRAGGVWKAMGAGNEIGIFVPDEPARTGAADGAEPLAVASEGLRWLP